MQILGLLIWFLITGASLVVALLAFAGAGSVERGDGPGAPLEGVATVMGVLIGLLGAAGFAVSIWLRPRRLLARRESASVAFGLAVAVAVVSALGFRELVRKTGRFEFSVRVVDAGGKPLSGARVEWDGFQLGEGLGKLNPAAKGTAITDDTGIVRFTAYHPHRIDVSFTLPDGTRDRIILNHSGKQYGHQVFPPEHLTIRPLMEVPAAPGSITFPNSGDISIEIRPKGSHPPNQQAVEKL